MDNTFCSPIRMCSPINVYSCRLVFSSSLQNKTFIDSLIWSYPMFSESTLMKSSVISSHSNLIYTQNPAGQNWGVAEMPVIQVRAWVEWESETHCAGQYILNR